MGPREWATKDHETERFRVGMNWTGQRGLRLQAVVEADFTTVFSPPFSDFGPAQELMEAILARAIAARGHPDETETVNEILKRDGFVRQEPPNRNFKASWIRRLPHTSNEQDVVAMTGLCAEYLGKGS